jgi:2-polyprenyl-6-methoxyphenol hydroxylase-like FAD-dependent oxidoreductase
VAAGCVIGADGLSSTVARQVGAETRIAGSVAVAHVYAYASAPALTGYHWYFAAGVSGGMIPTHDGQACVVVSVPAAEFKARFAGDLATGRQSALRELAPALADHAARNDTGRVKAFRGHPGMLRRAAGDGWMLVGDAGFFRDPLTSHGISDALRDAEGATAAILSGSSAAFRRYEQERDSMALPILEMTDAIASFDWTLGELPERHKRFSEAMKAEIAAMTARSNAVEIAPNAERTSFAALGKALAL